EWPPKGRTSFPVVISHNRTQLSPAAPETSIFPFGDRASDQIPVGCACHFRSSLPVARSHRRIVPSPFPEAKVLPSGRKTTELTWPTCPPKARRSFPVDTSHRRIVWS